MPDSGWWEALWSDPRAVLDRSQLGTGLNVVDLCSGDGWFTRAIAERSKHVYAIDIDPDLLRLGAIRLAEADINNCTFIAGDAYDVTNTVPAKVDFVFLANAYHGVPDKPRLCRAVYGALVPGGKFAIVNWYARPRKDTKVLGEPRGPKTEFRMSPQRTIDSVVGSGLIHLLNDDVSPYHYVAVFERPQ